MIEVAIFVLGVAVGYGFRAYIGTTKAGAKIDEAVVEAEAKLKRD